MKKLKKIHQDRGFTIVEVMIAIMVLALAFLGLIGMQTSTTKNNVSARITWEATDLAADQAEILMNTPIEDLADGFELRDNYRISWTITTNAPSNGFTTINMTVTPVSQSLGLRKTVSFDYVRTDEIIM